jgi:hypothetical protein
MAIFENAAGQKFYIPDERIAVADGQYSIGLNAPIPLALHEQREKVAGLRRQIAQYAMLPEAELLAWARQNHPSHAALTLLNNSLAHEQQQLEQLEAAP